MKKISLKKDDNILVSNHLIDFFDPREVYVPLIKEGVLNIKSKIVKKGEMIFKNINNNIFSPISGNLKEIVTIDNQKYLVIANNFKEELKRTYKKKLKYSKEEINNLINKFYPNFQLVKTSNVLYFKALSDDIYNANNYFIFKNYQDELLDLLDFLREVYEYQEVRILLKENDGESIKIFSNILGSYPFINITLLPDIYPITNDVILEEILQEKIDYLTVTQCLNLIEAIFYHQPLLDCYLTISGNLVEPVVVKIKKGTSLKEILNKLNIKEKEAYVNNILNHKKNIEHLIINEDISSILFFAEPVKDVRPCISCGKCLSVCPMGCEPIFNKKMDKCISCGLCEYICPSNLTLRKE